MQPVINLSKRLQKISDLIQPCKYLIDVGCDHGYLIIYLLLNNKIEHGINIDINKKPLQSAYQNSKNYNLLDKIDFINNNGLKNLNIKHEINYVTISGMGGYLISNIINECQLNVDKFVLQPNNNIPMLREWLFNNKFLILNEIVVFDNEIYYIIIETKKTNKTITFNKEDVYIGPILKKQTKNIDTIRYYENKLSTLLKIPSKYIENDKMIELNIIKEFLNVKN